jgi:hypothetical protein
VAFAVSLVDHGQHVSKCPPRMHGRTIPVHSSKLIV